MKYTIFKEVLFIRFIAFGYDSIAYYRRYNHSGDYRAGWNTFFAGVQKGAEKVGITKAFKNLTSDIENSINKVVKNTT